ncbi:hypothetical protein V8D89_001231 [Ganoderma adspersum]
MSSIRNDMECTDQKQRDQVREIEELWQVLEEDVIEHLAALTQDVILEEIDDVV